MDTPLDFNNDLPRQIQPVSTDGESLIAPVMQVSERTCVEAYELPLLHHTTMLYPVQDSRDES